MCLLSWGGPHRVRAYRSGASARAARNLQDATSRPSADLWSSEQARWAALWLARGCYSTSNGARGREVTSGWAGHLIVQVAKYPSTTYPK